MKSDRGKKAAATILIILFSFMLASSNSQTTSHPPADLAEALGRLVGILLLITGLIFSIKWQVKLAGYTNTSGRQAVAIFLIVFCGLGIFLVLMLAGMSLRESATGMILSGVMGAIYGLGLYASARWLKRLRRVDKTLPEPSGTLTAVSGK